MAVIQISEDLLAELRVKSEAEGKTVEQLAGEALRVGLEEREWQDLLDYGRRKGGESGLSEHQVPEVVRQWRSEQRNG
jgi:plasmid stability protein